MKRCAWVTSSELYIEYHDTEWEVPSFYDRHLFEMLILEGAQAGLSWITILNKRESYRTAYSGFDPEKVASFTRRNRRRLLSNAGIVRNRLKVDASIENANAFLKVQAEFGSFSEFIWGFVNGKPIHNRRRTPREIPAETPRSREMSKALKTRSFRFAGPTICYAFMQAVGMVNDHETGCFRYRELSQ